ncbi:hypothetical protein LINGRAHAP2_LOCUS20544 [Linum grandiflorum]
MLPPQLHNPAPKPLLT